MTGWINTENIQALGAVVAIVTSVGWVYDRFVVRRRRLSYRVHWNRPIDVTPAVAHNMDLSIVRGGEVVTEPSVVVLRVENVGSFDIDEHDVRAPLEFAFGGRRIVHYEVQETDPADLVSDIVRTDAPPELLPGPDGAPAGVLRLPPFAMNRKARFKLLVLLSGATGDVSARGKLAGGDVVRESRRGSGSRRGLALGLTSIVLVVALTVWYLNTRDGRGSAVACPAPGTVSITGSTVLEPALSEIADEYMAACSSAQVVVRPTATETAIDSLLRGGLADEERNSTESSRAKLAMADEYAGRPPREPQLHYWPVGVAAFAVVANHDSGITRLTSEQVRRLFAGELPRWDDAGLGGGDRPVALVSRTAGSGTRDAFAARVLGAEESAPVSSSDCVSKDIPGQQDAVMHCALGSTEEVLRTVAQTKGAIGYASAAEAEAFKDQGVDVVPLDGYYPDKDAVASGRYRFWAVEKLYRYGQERPPTVRDHFVAYLQNRPAALKILAEQGFFACNDPAFLAGEVADACGQG